MTELKKALIDKIKKFEGFKTDPKFKSETEQNAVFVTLRELRYLDSIVEIETDVDETQLELRELRQWKEDAMSLLKKIDDYTDQAVPTFKLGTSKIDETIRRAKQYDGLLKYFAMLDRLKIKWIDLTMVSSRS